MLAAREVERVSEASRRRALRQAGLVHPREASVSAPLFDGSQPFFLAADKVQVKYEMLRAHLLGGTGASAAAAAHGYSRAAFYLAAAAFDERGMAGLVDDRRGRKGPLKVTPELVTWLAGTDPARSGADLVDEVERRFGVRLHRRTIERARP
jgi:transposase